MISFTILNELRLPAAEAGWAAAPPRLDAAKADAEHANPLLLILQQQLK